MRFGLLSHFGSTFTNSSRWTFRPTIRSMAGLAWVPMRRIISPPFPTAMRFAADANQKRKALLKSAFKSARTAEFCGIATFNAAVISLVTSSWTAKMSSRSRS